MPKCEDCVFKRPIRCEKNNIGCKVGVNEKCRRSKDSCKLRIFLERTNACDIAFCKAGSRTIYEGKKVMGCTGGCTRKDMIR